CQSAATTIPRGGVGRLLSRKRAGAPGQGEGPAQAGWEVRGGRAFAGDWGGGCVGGGLGRRGRGRRRLRLAGSYGWRRITLGIGQEAHLLAYGRTPPCGSFGLLRGLPLA